MSSAEWLVLIGLGWLACSVLAYGISYAYFLREYTCLLEYGYYEKECRRDSIRLAVYGPFALVVACFGSNRVGGKWRKHGLKFFTKGE